MIRTKIINYWIRTFAPVTHPMVLTSIGAVTSGTVTRSITSTMSTWLLAFSSIEMFTAFWIYFQLIIYSHTISTTKRTKGQITHLSNISYLTKSEHQYSLNHCYFLC